MNPDNIGWEIEPKASAPEYTGDTYKNHGDYVRSIGGGEDAAHSPIGKPVQATIKA